jgi:hypothetical protein
MEGQLLYERRNGHFVLQLRVGYARQSAKRSSIFQFVFVESSSSVGATSMPRFDSSAKMAFTSSIFLRRRQASAR